MKKQNKESVVETNQLPKRRLSIWRVLLALIILTVSAYGLVTNVMTWKDNVLTADLEPWFASYVDVTATPQYDFEQLGASPSRNVLLSFIVSSSSDACTPTWGNAYTLDKAGSELDLDRRIARLRQQGGDVAVSFGGLLNNELATNCIDTDSLLKAYENVIERYEVDIVDLDIEGSGLTDTDAGIRRAVTIAKLQEKRRKSGKSLAVWLTLPVSPHGLTEDGTNAVAEMLERGVDLAGVNVMTMDYGQSREKGMSMQEASERALAETHRQLSILYRNAEINLSSASVWKKIGATPMIGQNDVVEEIFTLKDAKGFNEFATSQGVIRMSMWSVNRDIECGENYVNLSVVSDSCSGVKQDKLNFSTVLGLNFEGSLHQNAAVVTKEDVVLDTQQEDDPKNSPYQIWSEFGVYLEGTKVVWHGNVYQAKWWTQDDLPDNPVLQAWQTPWQLVGPVLPGEKPIKQATLPKGTYDEWLGTQQYDTGDRVLFSGVPFEAKWWTQGDSPAAATSNPTSSPWRALTQLQIEEIINGL